MKLHLSLLLFLTISFNLVSAQEPRVIINLNGTWDFDQTTTAFTPQKFTREVPVPGLIHLAVPKIEEYDRFFKRAEKAESKEQFNLYNLDYTPRYSWYRKKIFIPRELEKGEGVITLRKSQYVTQVYINGMDMGSSEACYTPIEFPVGRAIKFGEINEIMVKAGERVWLPADAAGGTDKEKEHYLPGIWDDVFLSFTGKLRINRLLILPSVAEKKLIIKTQIRNFIPAQIYYGDPMNDSLEIGVTISEKLSGKKIIRSSGRFKAKRDNLTETEIDIPFPEFSCWTPEAPFLYEAEVIIKQNGKVSDDVSKHFGMRDFNAKGKFFFLNGSKYLLRGTNITLQRFFEDPDCGNLVWNREWVRKLLAGYPKQLNWNAMRICVGVVPDFWYDIADECGLLFQNEWLYWQNHGWNDEIRKEYTDWVWSDGSHPSIAIWDAINENTDEFIGNTLIPELKKLDPTRIWDAGYMREGLMKSDEMDEPHPYQGRIPDDGIVQEKDIYPLGNLDFKPYELQMVRKADVPQLANEYGWIWLWRNGSPAKLTVNEYNYYLGKNSTPAQNREFQAYYLQLETEWLRSEPQIAGVLAFCYLTNNYGYTGDWFVDNIKNLDPSPTLRWFSHAFSPAAVFINLTDERYVKNVIPHKTGEKLNVNLVKMNDTDSLIKGSVTIRIVDSNGKTVEKRKLNISMDPFDRSALNVDLNLPGKAGGYLLLAEFQKTGGVKVVMSRRFLKVGELAEYEYFDQDSQFYLK